jgi:hypothetical protein
VIALLEDLADVGRIHAQILKLASRARGRRVAALAQDGVAFASLVAERDHVAPLLAAALADGSFRPSPVRVTRAVLAGRARDVARLAALDHVAHAAVAEVLAARIEPTLSPALWSYRRGRSAWQALRWLARVAREHRRARPDVRTRGLFVLRADVKSYTDSIPLGDGSPLWTMLTDASGVRAGERGWDMLRALLRARVRDDAGGETERTRGLLFGAPTTTVVANLYLRSLDAELGAPRPLELGGYARFGDDVAVVSPDPDMVRAAALAAPRVLAALGLELNAAKVRVLAWNGAARPHAAWPEAHAASGLDFLGAEVRFDGTIRLPTRKWRRALRDVRGRILRTAAQLPDVAAPERARALAAIVGDALAPSSEVAVDTGPMLAGLVDDRAQLEELDHLLALWIAEAATGERGPRAFRAMSPRWLREEGGLASRVVLKNRG